MKTVVEFLAENPGHYFATVGTDGKPKVRSFQFMLEKDGKLFFCTSNQKPVFTEMMKQPFVEICATGADNSWMRLRGKAVFTKDIDIKAKMLELSPLVKMIYRTPDNPILEAFYLDEALATISDFSGNPPMVIKM